MKIRILVLVLIVCAVVPAYADKAEAGKAYRSERAQFKANVQEYQAKEDLDGDGIPDMIRVNWQQDNLTTIQVNKAKLQFDPGALEAPGRFWITDVDKKDSFKEVVIWCDDSDTACRAWFFRYDGKSIKNLGKVSSFENAAIVKLRSYNIEVDGTGSIWGIGSGQILHSWFYPEEYRLSPTGKLEIVERPLYPMNSKVILKRDLRVVKDRSQDSGVKIIKAGSKGEIVQSDNKIWCEIKADGGIRGWFKVEKWNQVEGLPSYEFFDGLFFAD